MIECKNLDRDKITVKVRPERFSHETIENLRLDVQILI